MVVGLKLLEDKSIVLLQTIFEREVMKPLISKGRLRHPPSPVLLFTYPRPSPTSNPIHDPGPISYPPLISPGWTLMKGVFPDFQHLGVAGEPPLGHGVARATPRCCWEALWPLHEAGGERQRQHIGGDDS
jgi:hypothetical protein